MSAIVTSEEQLKGLLEGLFKAVVAEVLPGLVQEALYKPLLTRKEVKALTGLSDRKLQYLRDEGKLGYVKDKGVILYPTQGLLSYLQENYVPATGCVAIWTGAGTITTRTLGQNLSR